MQKSAQNEGSSQTSKNKPKNQGLSKVFCAMKQYALEEVDVLTKVFFLQDSVIEEDRYGSVRHKHGSSRRINHC